MIQASMLIDTDEDFQVSYEGKISNSGLAFLIKSDSIKTLCKNIQHILLKTTFIPHNNTDSINKVDRFKSDILGWYKSIKRDLKYCGRSYVGGNNSITIRLIEEPKYDFVIED